MLLLTPLLHSRDQSGSGSYDLSKVIIIRNAHESTVYNLPADRFRFTHATVIMMPTTTTSTNAVPTIGRLTVTANDTAGPVETVNGITLILVCACDAHLIHTSFLVFNNVLCMHSHNAW